MSDITLTFAILVVVVAMFIWNKFPAAIVAVGSARLVKLARWRC